MMVTLRPTRGTPTRPRRLTALLVLALALYTGATACADGEPEKTKDVTLSVFWWGGPTREKLTREALDLYTKRHPNVKFAMKSQPYSGYYDSLETMIAGGNSLDIFQIDDNSLTEYAGRGIALDLSGHLGAGKAIDSSKLPQSLIRYGTIQGRPYAVAAAENTTALVYDKTVVRQYGLPEPQIGWSYQQLIAWARKITKASGGKIGGTISASANYKALWVWLRAQGKELYADGKLGFTAADLQRWFQMWNDARKSGAILQTPPVAGKSVSDVTSQMLVLKQAATAFVWSNQLAEMQKGTDHELGITAYPGDPRGQWARASLYWSIYKGSKNTAAAADVINFLINDVEAGKILGVERGLPANLEIRKTISGSLTPVMQRLLAFETAVSPKFGPAPAPPPQGHGEITTLLNQASDNVYYDRVTPEHAAARFVTQAQRLLTR